MGVSIIMPVYNIPEDYIYQCVESVRKQTYKDWELLIINDGSNEQCSAYLDTFASDSIKVIHQPNGGVSVARNNGLKMATKEWITFVDPDDWMSELQLETLLRVAEEENADCVCANTHLVYGKKVIPAVERDAKKVFHGDNGIHELMMEVVSQKNFSHQKVDGIENGVALVVPWGKLYRNEILKANGIQFPLEIHPDEDTIFILKYWRVCKTVVLLNDYLHYYRINEGSVTIRYRDTWIPNNQRVLHMLHDFLEDYLPGQNYRREENAKAMRCLLAIMRLQVFHPNNPQSRKERGRLLHRAIQGTPAYKRAIWDIFNPYYMCRWRIIALMCILRAYWLLNLYYGRIKQR